jgi:transglutaminase-like putative cysteine protease
MAGVLLGIMIMAGSHLCQPPQVTAQEVGVRTILYSFTLHNQGNRFLQAAELWTYAPTPRAAKQQRMQVSVSLPHERHEDELGNQILHFTLPPIPPYATKTITIRTELSAAGKDPSATAATLQRYLQPYPGVESTDPTIVQQAKALHGATALETAEKIYTWVVHNIEDTGYATAETGAVATLRDRRGDCTEFMALFVALARAAGLPARGLAGYLHPESGILRPTEFHNWAEFYADGSWQIVDPQRQVFRAPATDYIAMRIIGQSSNNPMAADNRFRFQGEDLAVTMNP